MQGFKDLRAWNAAMDVAEAVYEVTARYPRREIFGLAAQTRESAASIAANIAEGVGRRSRRDFARFLRIAIGSANETETHLLLADRLGYLSIVDSELDRHIADVRRMLTGLIRHLEARDSGDGR